MPSTDAQSAGEHAKCLACGYTLHVPRDAGRCSECGEPLRNSVDRFRLKQTITRRAQLSAGVGLVSVILMPLLGPLAIYMGWRALRDARAHGIKGQPRVMAIGAIVMGLLCFFSLLLILDVLLSD